MNKRKEKIFFKWLDNPIGRLVVRTYPFFAFSIVIVVLYFVVLFTPTQSYFTSGKVIKTHYELAYFPNNIKYRRYSFSKRSPFFEIRCLFVQLPDSTNYIIKDPLIAEKFLKTNPENKTFIIKYYLTPKYTQNGLISIFTRKSGHEIYIPRPPYKVISMLETLDGQQIKRRFSILDGFVLIAGVFFCWFLLGALNDFLLFWNIPTKINRLDNSVLMGNGNCNGKLITKFTHCPACNKKLADDDLICPECGLNFN